tara:strand:+ start:777 stop:941 length:165 start_codon:yes stop_codon:yes gene_type:complete
MRDKTAMKHLQSKHVHRTPVDMSNPHKPSKEDWWDEICKKHGEKNYFPKDKKKK